MYSMSIRNILRRSLLFVSWRLRSRGEDPLNYIVQKGVTDICIDGYPRSANSFSVRMFKKANPEVSIAHHTHSVANLRKAIKCDIPIIVLIRNPEQSIVSSVIAHKKNDVNEEVYRYIDFYKWVYEHINFVVIAEFDKVVNDFNSVILDVNTHYGLSYSVLDNLNAADAQVKTDIEERFDKLGQLEMAHIKPVPTSGRDKIKDSLRNSVLMHHRFREAQELYNKIVQRAVK